MRVLNFKLLNLFLLTGPEVTFLLMMVAIISKTTHETHDSERKRGKYTTTLN